MAVDIILLIDGIKGETQIKEFKDKGGIDVLSWNWGMTQSGTTHMGPGGGSGKVNVSDVTFTKYLDLSTPDLLKACTSGRSSLLRDLSVASCCDARVAGPAAPEGASPGCPSGTASGGTNR